MLRVDEEHRMIAEAISAGDDSVGREAYAPKGSPQCDRDMVRGNATA